MYELSDVVCEVNDQGVLGVCCLVRMRMSFKFGLVFNCVKVGGEGQIRLREGSVMCSCQKDLNCFFK